MKRILNDGLFIVLILASLFLSPLKLQAVLGSNQNIVNQTIETQKDKRKELRQEKRKLKRSKHQKKRIDKTVGGIALIVLFVVIVALVLVLSFLILSLAIDGEPPLAVVIGIAALLAISVWGILKLNKALRKNKKSKGKKSL